MRISRSSDADNQSVDECHLREIQQGLEEARAGKLVDYETVKSDWMKWLSDRPSR